MSSQLFDKLFVQQQYAFLEFYQPYLQVLLLQCHKSESILDLFSPVRPITFIFIS